jgi:hypothetical protein
MLSRNPPDKSANCHHTALPEFIGHQALSVNITRLRHQNSITPESTGSAIFAKFSGFIKYAFPNIKHLMNTPL